MLKAYPALNGDCFLLTIGEFSMLIDGGYVDTYNEYLKADLAALGKPLNLVMVTHIDSDHISGINKLFEENSGKAIVAVDEVWHNAFRHIQPYSKPSEVLDNFKGKALNELKPEAYLSSTVPLESEIKKP